MRISNRMIWATLMLSVAMASCSSGGDALPGPSTTGGSDGVGGASAKGGSSANATKGGSAAQEVGGASTHSGGSSAADTSSAELGGDSSAGGKSATTGTTAASSIGGASNTTGVKTGTGGKAATTAGGTTATGAGGKAASGGDGTGGKATGGAKAGGGTSAAGGAVSNGGKAAGGAQSAGGGSIAAGGKVSAGGSVSAGAPTSFKCDNLSKAPTTTGVAKPTGTAGGLKVLDWAGFKGAVSFTFDDNMTTGSYSKFRGTGAHVTLMVTSAMSGYDGYTGAPSYGDEIGNHSSTHTQNASSTGYSDMQSTIQSKYSVTAYTGASPYGDSSWISPAKNLFIANRGVSNGDIKPRTATDTLLFNLPAFIPNSGANSATMSAEIKAGIWKVFCVHGWASPAYNPINESDMISTMTKAVSDGYWAESMVNVAAYFIGQNAISASATTSATWTLPAHFPPNMCVRITTTGGTVTQNGAEVPWDDHGYYQISLDAKSVTIQ